VDTRFGDVGIQIGHFAHPSPDFIAILGKTNLGFAVVDNFLIATTTRRACT